MATYTLITEMSGFRPIADSALAFTLTLALRDDITGDVTKALSIDDMQVRRNTRDILRIVGTGSWNKGTYWRKIHLTEDLEKDLLEMIQASPYIDMVGFRKPKKKWKIEDLPLPDERPLLMPDEMPAKLTKEG